MPGIVTSGLELEEFTLSMELELQDFPSEVR